MDLLPERTPEGNKSTFGKVLLLAGSKNMAGAAILAAKATYNIGAGMVKVLTPEENRIILQEVVPEALLGNYEDLEDSLKWADVIAIGPGLGQSVAAEQLLESAIYDTKLPLIIDADGLNLLAKNAGMQEEISRQGKARAFILTPHVGELSRLMNRDIASLKEMLPAVGMELAMKLHATVVAKDARTYICNEEHPICMNINGNSGMATAGSGDVLTGTIAGLLAQKKDSFYAASVGTYAHAWCGDKVSASKSEYACMAGDIADALCDMSR